MNGPRLRLGTGYRAAVRLAAAVRQRATRGRVLIALLAAVAVVATSLTALGGWPSGGQLAIRWAPAEKAPATPTPPNGSYRPLAVPPVVSPPADEFVGWALLDLRTGALTGSWNRSETSTTASMIKVWIAADELRRTTEAGEEPTRARLDQLRIMIRDSDNAQAETVFRHLGADESIERLIDICGLTDSSPVRTRWSNTQLSPRDTARMGACIADGRAAGPEWTDWLLDEMRAVRGIGDFGIRSALRPEVAAEVAIKNGWVVRSDVGEYHVNCLAIGAGWAMGVMTRFPAHLGYEYGAEHCRSLAARHLPDLAGAEPVWLPRPGAT